MLVIVGLGNYGLSYRDTFHNTGFMAVDKLAGLLGVDFKHRYCRAKSAEYFYRGEKIVIAKPQTYMNLSGESVRELAGKFGVKPTDIIVVYDDIDLPTGTLRIRASGSPGTHNGMRNIVSELNSTDIPRIRVGIGKPQGAIGLADYVLSKARGEAKEILDAAAEKAAEALKDYIENRSIIGLSQRFNG